MDNILTICQIIFNQIVLNQEQSPDSRIVASTWEQNHHQTVSPAKPIKPGVLVRRLHCQQGDFNDRSFRRKGFFKSHSLKLKGNPFSEADPIT